MFYCGFCTKLLLFPLINIQKQNWDMLDQVAWGPCSVPEPPKGKWHCTWLVMLSVSAAWNVHICVHKPLHAMAKYALQCQTICALASLGCVRMLLGRDDNKEWGTVNSSSLSFKAITCRAWGVWCRQETDSTVLVIWSFLLSCAAVSTPAIPQGCPPAGSWCWTQGIKPGLIFCWIFLGRDWTWNQTGMSKLCKEEPQAPGNTLGRPWATGPGARAYHKLYGWAAKHKETLPVPNHHKANSPEIRTVREERRGRRRERGRGRIMLLQKPSNCTCKTFIWHYSWIGQSRFTWTTPLSSEFKGLISLVQVTVPGSELPGWKSPCWSSELKRGSEAMGHLAWLSISHREGQHVLPLAAGTWDLSAL